MSLPFLNLLATTVVQISPNLPTPRVVPLPPPDPMGVVETLPPQDVLPLPPTQVLPRQEIMEPQELRPLTGTLDRVPTFNSNSPEVVQSAGILLSTFPPQGMRVPSAHLNYAFNGRFDIFTHHIARVRAPGDPSSLFQGILVQNPGEQTVTLEILQAASYLTRPDALFVELPNYLDNPLGRVFSGPGSRTAGDVLRGVRQGIWPTTIEIPPGESRMLMNLPIPVGDRPNDDRPASNARSTLIRLRSSGPVYVANMAMFAPTTPEGRERVPTLEEWQGMLLQAGLAGPRDHLPTPFDLVAGISLPAQRFTYGRVAGVSIGSRWEAILTDRPDSDDLTIPNPGQAFSYGISTLYRGRLNTAQIQTAAMVVRYPDTAYQAHGNYGLEYNLTLPLYNPSRQQRTVTLKIQTPVKEDAPRGGVVFLDPPDDRVFFRGTVRLRYQNGQGNRETRLVHIVQRRGQQGEPIATLSLPPGGRNRVEVDLVYPPDATPPQILTVTTLAD